MQSFSPSKGLAALAMATLFVGCVFETSRESPPPVKSLAYSVKVSREAEGISCSVSVRIENWPAQEPILFQLPAYYPDNPLMPVPGISPLQIRIEDGFSNALAARKVAAPFVQGGGEWMDLPSKAKQLTYGVDLDPPNPGRFGPPMPGLEPGVQMLDGSQLFILPWSGNTLASHWRNPVQLRLNWQMGAGVSVMSDSSSSMVSNYELMFSRGAVNPVRTLEFISGTHRVTLYSNSLDDTLDMGALATRLQRWIPLLENRLLPLRWEHLWIGTNSVHAGIEGVGGYWFKPKYEMHAELHFHELMHSFVGVLQGDLNDPWWKEGVTNYLGKVLAAQDGFYDDSVAMWDFLKPFDQVPSVVEYALSDPGLRDRYFHPLDSDYVDRPPVDFYTLLYGKGGQAAMLIDAWLLQSSHGKHDLLEAVRVLYQTGVKGFSRQQLVDVLERLSGLRADTLLQSLCDKPGAFPAERLRQAFDELRAYNRFSPSEFGQVAAKRSGIPLKTGDWKAIHPTGKF